ncbi:MAG: MBL fold metallo-hydrolase [Gammaproteobacteria bacterium AqS3]|nr:MBL fold metallo-hydrolase [Gammaproteobacteria bacterium AqS3]
MTDLFKLSGDIVDSGAADVTVNRITQELSELGDGLAVVESFSHSVVFDTGEGLVVFDTSGANTGEAVVEAIRGWRQDPLHSVVYTHGHLDHVGGSGAFLRDALDKGGPAARPRFIGHERVIDRIHRYRMTGGYNNVINQRQFVGMQRHGYGIGLKKRHFIPHEVVEPDVTYRQKSAFRAGELTFELHHALGETDDHTWGWIPERRIICAGDFFIWNFPNCGNPQKVQRYPKEWAQALRDMAAMNPEVFIPAHGLPISGAERIRRVLDEVAGVLEYLVDETLEMMNDGAPLNDIIHSVRVDPDLLEKPWLRPFYDEPEFIVNNLWRYYGGWYGGEPDRLKPARVSALGQEYCRLLGGAGALIARAQELSDAGEHRLACHLIETAVQGEPDNLEAHDARARIYTARRSQETSMMAKGIYAWAANESKEKSGQAGGEGEAS